MIRPRWATKSLFQRKSASSSLLARETTTAEEVPTKERKTTTKMTTMRKKVETREPPRERATRKRAQAINKEDPTERGAKDTTMMTMLRKKQRLPKSKRKINPLREAATKKTNLTQISQPPTKTRVDLPKALNEVAVAEEEAELAPALSKEEVEARAEEWSDATTTIQIFWQANAQEIT